MVSLRRTRRQAGISLLEMLALLILVACLATVALPRFVDLRAAARAGNQQQAVERLRATVDALTLKWHAAGQPEVLVLDDGTAIRFINGAPAASSLLTYPGWQPPGFFLFAVHGDLPVAYLMHCDRRQGGSCALPGQPCTFTYFNAVAPGAGYRLDKSGLDDPSCR